MNLHSPLAAIEAKRLASGVSREQLAGLAGLSERHYRRLVEDGRRPRDTTLAKLKTAVARLARNAGDAIVDDHTRLIRTCFRAALGLVCQEEGADPSEVLRHDPSRRATGDRAWMAAADLRSRALVVVNQGLDVKQSEIAKALSMTPAAVCVAMRRVEDLREGDDKLDAQLDRLSGLMNGGEW